MSKVPWHERRFVEYDGEHKGMTLPPGALFAILDMFLLYGGMLLIYLL